MRSFRLSTRVQLPLRRPAGGASRRSSVGGPGCAPAGGSASGVPVGGAPAAGLPGGAVEVPWRVTRRSPSGVIEVEHVGEAPLHSVRFALAGDGLLGLSLPRTVLPGERVRVALRGARGASAYAAPDAMLVLRWFQPDGRELLWPIAL